MKWSVSHLSPRLSQGLERCLAVNLDNDEFGYVSGSSDSGGISGGTQKQANRARFNSILFHSYSSGQMCGKEGISVVIGRQFCNESKSAMTDK